jgi:Skp family chaperone for outer membrane proteins
VALQGLHAQSPQGGMGIAVIDISYIFKNHIRFKQNMEFMKKDVMAAEDNLKKDRDHINAMIEKLKSFNPGTPDYKKMEEDITHLQSDFNVRASLQKKEFLEREAKVYTNVYKEIADETKRYAEKFGIAIVLRFNGDPVDPNNRNSVLNEINKPIVYQRNGIDITPYILDGLNRGAPLTPGPSNPSAMRPGGPVNQPATPSFNPNAIRPGTTAPR